MQEQMEGRAGEVLARLPLYNPNRIDLRLERIRGFLERLGRPQEKLAPVFHVAGTNGKGSTCAFLRAILEASGRRCHVYTSPHLVEFRERIRLNGRLISDADLAALCEEAGRKLDGLAITFFEFTTALAFMAFAREETDAVILEVGLGGRLDATNVVRSPTAAGVARLSYDHREALGNSLPAIAYEKAGIFKPGCPAVFQAQPDILKNDGAQSMLRRAAHERGAILYEGGLDWQVMPHAGGSGFHYRSQARSLDLPMPALPGPHQVANAGLAVAMLERARGFAVEASAIADGLLRVEWPARLQRLPVPYDILGIKDGAAGELWLDGGHNDSAGEALAAQAALWQKSDARPLWLVYGMLTTKSPAEFLAPLKPYLSGVVCVPIAGEAKSHMPAALAQKVTEAGLGPAATAEDWQAGLRYAWPRAEGGRVLIAGSLYLAGQVLKGLKQAD